MADVLIVGNHSEMMLRGMECIVVMLIGRTASFYVQNAIGRHGLTEGGSQTPEIHSGYSQEGLK